MFGNMNKLAQGDSRSETSANYAQNVTQQPEYGVQSALKELEQNIAEVQMRGIDLRSTLGIVSQAPKQSGAGASTDMTLAQFIGNLTARLREASDDLADVLRHLNS